MILGYQQVKVFKKTKTGWSSTAITLDETKPKAGVGTGKKKDTFGFDANNANGQLFRTFHSGSGTNSFAWKWGTIPTDAEAEFEVFVDDVRQILGIDYSISDDDVVFTFIPVTGTNNIELRFPILEQEDLVQIFMRNADNSFVTSDIPLEGFVENVDRIERGDGQIVRASGVGMIEALFGILAFALAPNQTASDMIQNSLIPHVANFLSTTNRTILWNPANDVTTTNIDYTAKYKRAVEIVEDLASEPINKEGYYYFSMTKHPSLDRTYYFNFNKKTSSGETIDVVEGGENEPLDITCTYNSEVINAAIFNCGRAPNGSPIESLHFNRDKNISGSTKWKYITVTSGIASELLDREFQSNTDNWATTDDGNRNSAFPTSYAGGYTMQFTILDRNGQVKGDQEVNSDGEFNDAIKNKAIDMGRQEVQRIMDRGASRREVKFFKKFEGVNEIPLGQLLKVTSLKQGYNEVFLRVTQLEYTLKKLKVAALEDELVLE